MARLHRERVSWRWIALKLSFSSLEQGFGIMRRNIAVIGGKSLVGTYLTDLVATNDQCIAFTRQSLPASQKHLDWKPLEDLLKNKVSGLDGVICVSHIWVVPEMIELFAQAGARKVVAISSTSKFTKAESGTEKERALSIQLEEAEVSFMQKANECGIDWVILRPTLIHGDRIDKNVAEISRIIERFHFFPLFGAANGLRQPIHARDVAKACLSALNAPDASNRCYNISGGETLTYRAMVRRVFERRNKMPAMPSVPIWMFRIVAFGLRTVPRFRSVTVDMARRMNEDLVFDHREATKDFGFAPEQFQPD